MKTDRGIRNLEARGVERASGDVGVMQLGRSLGTWAVASQVSALLYGCKSEKLREAGVLRAEAIAFRDARDGAITDADWSSRRACHQSSSARAAASISSGAGVARASRPKLFLKERQRHLSASP